TVVRAMVPRAIRVRPAAQLEVAAKQISPLASTKDRHESFIAQVVCLSRDRPGCGRRGLFHSSSITGIASGQLGKHGGVGCSVGDVADRATDWRRRRARCGWPDDITNSPTIDIAAGHVV